MPTVQAGTPMTVPGKDQLMAFSKAGAGEPSPALFLALNIPAGGIARSAIFAIAVTRQAAAGDRG